MLPVQFIATRHAILILTKGYQRLEGTMRNIEAAILYQERCVLFARL
jgi:hypothetical protein